MVCGINTLSTSALAQALGEAGRRNTEEGKSKWNREEEGMLRTGPSTPLFYLEGSGLDQPGSSPDFAPFWLYSLSDLNFLFVK